MVLGRLSLLRLHNSRFSMSTTSRQKKAAKTIQLLCEELSFEQGTQVSMATTNKHHHTEKLSGGIYQPLYPLRPTKRE